MQNSGDIHILGSAGLSLQLYKNNNNKKKDSKSEIKTSPTTPKPSDTHICEEGAWFCVRPAVKPKWNPNYALPKIKTTSHLPGSNKTQQKTLERWCDILILELARLENPEAFNNSLFSPPNFLPCSERAPCVPRSRFSSRWFCLCSFPVQPLPFLILMQHFEFVSCKPPCLLCGVAGRQEKIWLRKIMISFWLSANAF